MNTIISLILLSTVLLNATAAFAGTATNPDGSTVQCGDQTTNEECQRLTDEWNRSQKK